MNTAISIYQSAIADYKRIIRESLSASERSIILSQMRRSLGWKRKYAGCKSILSVSVLKNTRLCRQQLSYPTETPIVAGRRFQTSYTKDFSAKKVFIIHMAKCALIVDTTSLCVL